MVAKVGEDVNLTVECQLGILLLKILLLIYLQGDDVVSLSVDTAFHGGEGALANLEANLEIVDFEQLLRLARLRIGILLPLFSHTLVLFNYLREFIPILLRLLGNASVYNSHRRV